MVTELLCIGGPLDGHTVPVADPDILPGQLALPHWSTADPHAVLDPVGAEAKPAWYVPVKMVLFDRMFWVLVHAPVRGDEPVMQHMLALKLLSSEAFACWESAPSRSARPERLHP